MKSTITHCKHFDVDQFCALSTCRWCECWGLFDLFECGCIKIKDAEQHTARCYED